MFGEDHTHRALSCDTLSISKKGTDSEILKMQETLATPPLFDPPIDKFENLYTQVRQAEPSSATQ